MALKSKCTSRETFTQKRAQNFGYKIDILTQGELSKIEVSKLLQKIWNFEVLYISQVKICYAREIKDINVYSSVFDPHVKGGDCWSQTGFDKWVSIHLSHLLSSYQKSSTCRAQHV